MFYTQFLKLCKEKGVKPTPLIKSLGLSSGNLKKWADGGSVSSETLVKLSKYFDVPIDFFFEDENTELSSINVIEEVNSFKIAFNAIRAHTDHIVSMLNGSTLSSHDLLKISKYLNCEPSYLINKEVINDSVSIQNDAIPAKDTILCIMTKLPTNDDYKLLQVRISRIIVANLAKKNIDLDDLIGIRLVEKKIRELFDTSIPDEKKKGLNFSDLVRISEAFNVSFDYMLTGNGN